ncbi:MAG: FtsX-like permease family protein, partial [Prolixibacteraceae bacterium]|nr:FtsX-like permease family protein [Prolixibacteraceae bacterium]
DLYPEDLGMIAEPVREQGLSAAQSGTDFSGLFLGLSFFILASSIILTALLFRLNLESRSQEVGVLSALGFRDRQVRNIFLLEGLVNAVVGGLAGLVLSVIYTSGIFRILNTLWYDIVRTNMLFIKILPFTLLLGLIVSLVVSVAAIYISLYRFQIRQTAELQKRTVETMAGRRSVPREIIMWLSLSLPLIIIFIQLLNPGNLNTSMFFISGGLLLIGLILVFRKILYAIEYQKSDKQRIQHLSRLNLTRNKGRSMTVVVLFALGTFIVVSTGSYKPDLLANAQDKSGGTGGFLFYAETTMPVLYNMNDPVIRSEEGIYSDFRAVQFRLVEGDDASCLNLNRISRPAIIGADPATLRGRFSFAVKNKDPESDDPWEALDVISDDGTIPAIADQTVIQWGLGKKVGDELLYQNEIGDTLRLKLIAGIKPSIFQGYVIISNNQFLKNYPSVSGSNIFLIDGDPGMEQSIGEELTSVYRDFGWEMTPAAKRLVEFYSVTNTYLSIFLALGALGMILGTLGLAVILARTILERRREIALMQAIGFSFRQLFRFLVNEYLLLLAAGVITGLLTAVLATLPAFLSANSDASFVTVVFVAGLILLNGVIWITVLSWFSLRKRTLINGLRVE